MNKVRIGAVVVSYNSADDLVSCLEGFLGQQSGSLKLEACVVDNNSKDASVAVAKKVARTHVIASENNDGFSVAVNKGIRYFRERQFDYVIILNPDATMQKKSVQTMLNAFESHKNIGAVGPAMLHADGTDASDGYYLKAPSFLTVACFSTGLRPYAIKRPWLMRRYEEDLSLGASRMVEQIPGACLLTSMAILDRIGDLDEDFAIWFEDVEWSYRARKFGLELWFEPAAKVVHEGGVSFAKWNDMNKAVTFYVSMKTFFKKHKPLSYPLVVLVILANSFLLFVKNRDRSNLVFAKRFLKQKKGLLPKA